MNNKGHCRGALAFSIIPTSLSLDHGFIFAFLSFMSCLSAASFPDWAEKLMKLPHRSLFHTLSIWVGLSMYSYSNLGDGPLWCVLFGFSCGGVSHWVGDVPNKQGLPIFTPKDRFALHLWESGKHQNLTVLVIFALSLSVAAMNKTLFNQVYSYIDRLNLINCI
ncbi:metal-dependent hydrolase [Aliivibrio salmonicida]|uniref:metal-dependent hydrolase n=1 Tax=Aliivibrio salmonicida TaxID=40269 RepID=UPI003D12B322